MDEVGFILEDPETGEKIGGKVEHHCGAIGIYLDGYSTNDSEHGAPIWLDFYNGKLELFVYSDINEQEPVKINMEKARDELYVVEP